MPEGEAEMQRLDKFLSEAGVASRKALREIIRAGRVSVNGVVVRSAEQKIDGQRDVIALDGAVVGGKRRVVLLLHKPAGYVTSTEDPRDPTVMELIPKEYRDVTPVGRLDKETEGLLLFTNDGALAHRLISPRHGVEKRYYAEHEGTATEEDVAVFAQGCVLRDGTVCLPAILEPQGPGRSIVRIREGKYHQVRRMLASRGKPVTYLRRIAEGGVVLGDLPLGMTRELTDGEVAALESVNFDEKDLERS